MPSTMYINKIVFHSLRMFANQTTIHLVTANERENEYSPNKHIIKSLHLHVSSARKQYSFMV